MLNKNTPSPINRPPVNLVKILARPLWKSQLDDFVSRYAYISKKDNSKIAKVEEKNNLTFLIPKRGALNYIV